MKKHIILSLFVFLLFVQITFAQNATETVEAKQLTNGITLELQEEAIEFLRATATDVNSLRTLENRISFSAEMAGLMWFTDEAEARQMFQDVIGNFRQLLAQYDSQLNALGITPEEDDFTLLGPSSNHKVTRKLLKALVVRQQITMNLAEHDPRLALEFFTETGLAISNPKFRKMIAERDKYFESKLLNEIAGRDIEIALKYGRENLKKGVNYQTVELLKKLYEENAEKGVEFGEDVVSAIKSVGLDDNEDSKLYVYDSLLDLGTESIEQSENGKKKSALFSQNAMRDIAEILAQEILKRDPSEAAEVTTYVSNVEKYAPARAVQIRAKFPTEESKLDTKSDAAIEKEIAKITGDSPPKTGSNAELEEESVEEKLLKDVASLGNKELSDEARQEIIGKARGIIAGLEDREKKLAALSALALQVAQLGDKELASEILEEARRLIVFQPVNYRDYMEIWMVISAYSKVNPERAFPLLENTIYKLNNLMEAFVEVGKFIDVTGDIVEDGEVQLGSFGGGMTRQILSGLSSSDTVVRNLSVADFERMKGISNRFNRPEVRVLAKMLVLRSVLGSLKEKDAKSEAEIVSEPN